MYVYVYTETCFIVNIKVLLYFVKKILLSVSFILEWMSWA